MPVCQARELHALQFARSATIAMPPQSLRPQPPALAPARATSASVPPISARSGGWQTRTVQSTSVRLSVKIAALPHLSSRFSVVHTVDIVACAHQFTIACTFTCRTTSPTINSSLTATVRVAGVHRDSLRAACNRKPGSATEGPDGFLHPAERPSSGKRGQAVPPNDERVDVRAK